MTKKQIDTKYRKLHDKLSARYYEAQEISKAEFDLLHGRLWDAHRRELLDAGLIPPERPSRDLAAEFDELRARIEGLERINP